MQKQITRFDPPKRSVVHIGTPAGGHRLHACRHVVVEVCITQVRDCAFVASAVLFNFKRKTAPIIIPRTHSHDIFSIQKKERESSFYYFHVHIHLILAACQFFLSFLCPANVYIHTYIHINSQSHLPLYLYAMYRRHTHPLTHSPAHPPTRMMAMPMTSKPGLCAADSLTHSLTHPLIHPLTHSSHLISSHSPYSSTHLYNFAGALPKANSSASRARTTKRYTCYRFVRLCQTCTVICFFAFGNFYIYCVCVCVCVCVVVLIGQVLYGLEINVVI